MGNLVKYAGLSASYWESWKYLPNISNFLAAP